MKTADKQLEMFAEELGFDSVEELNNEAGFIFGYNNVKRLLDNYASQFRIIDLLIERGVWVDIEPAANDLTKWRYSIYKNNHEPIRPHNYEWEFNSYTAALSYAVEWLKTNGYMEGMEI